MLAFVALVLLIPSLLFGGQLQEAAFHIADKDSTYVRELHNKNDHPRIDQYCKNVGSPRYSPYCAAGTYTWFKEASEQTGLKNPYYRTGSSGQMYFNALKNPMRFKFIKPRLVKTGAEKLKLGDIILWSHDPSFKQGHVGFLVEQLTNSEFHSVEPNTSGSNALSEQREQSVKSTNKGGVYHKHRVISDNPKMKSMGFVRAREE